MKVWYDARTGKQVRYGAAIARRLRNLGHEVVLTTREHPDTVTLARLLGEPVTSVGKYETSSLIARLQQSAERMLAFCRMFEEEPPDIGISHRSVELCRVAFGLGVPVVSTHDTVHNEVISRLTMPLTDFLVVSRAIPEKFYGSYGIEKVFQFDGVDEVAWIKGFESCLEVNYDRPLIVVRQMETRATYTVGKSDLMERFARKLASLGEVVFLPRYDRRPRDGLVVPDGFVDSASLVGCADLVLSIGGTMAREAALQGTPSIVIRPVGVSYVNNYLSEKGFPLFTVDASKVLAYAKKYVGKRIDVEDLLAKLEDPVDVIEKIMEEGR
jgi:hypothetical protein